MSVAVIILSADKRYNRRRRQLIIGASLFFSVTTPYLSWSAFLSAFFAVVHSGIT